MARDEHHTISHRNKTFYRVPAHLMHPGDVKNAADCRSCDINKEADRSDDACLRAICGSRDARRNGLSASSAVYLTKQNFLDFRLTGRLPGETP